jgi:rhamnosyl/mannosyltransferase
MWGQFRIPQAIGQEIARVLIVSAYAHPHIGGIEVVVGQQARSFAELGHQVTVVTSRCALDEPELEEVDGYTVVRIPAWNFLEKRIEVPFPIWSLSAVWRLAHLTSKCDVVLVHDVYYASSILAASLARLHGRPIFVTQHVAIVEHNKAFVKLVQKLVYATAGRLLWGWAETVTVYNRIVENFLHGHGVPDRKISLTYNGIDTKYFHPGTNEDKILTRKRYGLSPDMPIVLSVGRLVPKKGFQTLIAARGAEYEIVHVGPGTIPGDVPGVQFLGPIDRNELRDLYQACDIFVSTAVGEMLTLVMQEAMACSLPVVAIADEAYSRYELDPVGLALVDPDPDTLRSTLLDILNDPGRMRYMQTYSRWLAEERFDWSKNTIAIARQLTEVA